MIRSAAILARGLGTRMRRADATVTLDGSQSAAAAAGVKGMIPIAPREGNAAPRPFLDYVISGLADAGVTDVVLVLGGEHDDVRDYYARRAPPQRVRVQFANQEMPTGTAHAVTAASDVIGNEAFLVLNADNYYPSEALRWLVENPAPATIAFDRDALVQEGNIDAERVRAFAVLELSTDDRLVGIIEKPGERLDLGAESARWVGMNCWSVDETIVDGCRRVPKSTRGEYELPEAVALVLREGVNVRAHRVARAVLDLSSRADIQSVAERLSAVVPRP